MHNVRSEPMKGGRARHLQTGKATENVPLQRKPHSPSMVGILRSFLLHVWRFYVPQLRIAPIPKTRDALILTGVIISIVYSNWLTTKKRLLRHRNRYAVRVRRRCFSAGEKQRSEIRLSSWLQLDAIGAYTWASLYQAHVRSFVSDTCAAMLWIVKLRVGWNEWKKRRGAIVDVV